MCLIAAIVCGSAFARDKAPDGLYDGYTGFAMPAEPVLPAKESHPSLWFTSADLPALRSKLAADDFARTRWAAVQKLADLNKLPPTAPTATDKTDVIHKYYGAMSMVARAHALVALLTDDPAVAAMHRQRAVELLLRAYDGPIFELDSKKQGSAVDEIYRGSWLQNYAHAYDCVQSSLAPDVDAQIRERLAREAQCVYENLYDWTPTSPHNHLSKPAWGLGSIALALSSDPRAKAWLGRAIEAANKNTRYFFSGDGLYREGSHYLIFSLTNFVPFLYNYRNVSGVDGFSAFQPVFEAMVQVRNSHGWLPNIEDSYIRPTPTHLVAAAYTKAKTNLHSVAPLSEILTWSYQTCDLAPFEQERGDSGFNYTGASWDYPLEIDELLTHDAAIRGTAPDCDPNQFLAGGQTVLRNSWDAQNAGQRYLLFHGVAVADNHNHDDQLSFILEAEGQMMCSDGGYSRGTYTGAERTAWYNTALAHNTLTFAGQPADKEPTNRTPPVSFRIDQPGLAGEEKSAFFGRKATWRRAIFWVGSDYYVVIDRVDASQPGEMKSFLHGGRGSLASEGARHTWTYTSDRYGPAAQLHAWIAAPGATVTEKNGELTYIKGDFAEFPYLETAGTNVTAPWITVLKPATPGDETAFDVEDHSAAGRTTFLIKSANETTVVSASSGPAAFSADGVETDAALVVVRRDAAGKVLNHFTQGGVYLRVDGRNLPL
ncbi:MAG TPA: heparinase II/III family protein, partial [Candidatus Didemnitutus sp.]|nr:heparinase II/III family protein [Candidatus Didemnitutus sp.]